MTCTVLICGFNNDVTLPLHSPLISVRSVHMVPDIASHCVVFIHRDVVCIVFGVPALQGLALLTLSWDKNWESHSLLNGYPSFYPRIALVTPSPGDLSPGCGCACERHRPVGNLCAPSTLGACLRVSHSETQTLSLSCGQSKAHSWSRNIAALS